MHRHIEMPSKWCIGPRVDQRRKPPIDFLELSGAGIRIPHAFPPGFTLGSVLRITLQEMRRIPLRDSESQHSAP